MKRYTFNPQDLELLERMRDFVDAKMPSGDDPRAPENNVWLSSSLQGWDADSFRREERAGKVPIQDEIFDREPDDWEDGRANRVILLGVYIAGPPSKIILFPEAIRLVARSPRFTEPLPSGNTSSYDLLFQSVLIHELAHWFTLDPIKHTSRLGLNRHHAPPEQGSRPSLAVTFTEVAETLAELLSWLTANAHGANDRVHALDLLRCQYLLKEPAASYEYQLYAFWLAYTGLVDTCEQLQGKTLKTLDCVELGARLSAIKTWIQGDDIKPASTLAHEVYRAGHDSKLAKKRLYPGFIHPSLGYSKVAEALWIRAIQDYEQLEAFCVNDSDIDVLNI